MLIFRPGPDGLVLAREPEPVPEPHQALVRIEAFSLNPSDTLRLRAPGSCWRPGMDLVGRIERAAADGSGPAPGTRVVAVSPGGGAAAQCAAVATADLVRAPESLAAQLLAALPLAGLTALRLLRAAGDPAGRRVLATGAGGAVGAFLVESAAARGAVVTAVAARAAHERLRALGAAVRVEAVADASGPFDVVFESVGGASLNAALAATAPRGFAAWYGASGGEPVTLDFFALARAARGVTLRHFVWDDGDSNAADLDILVRAVAEGRLRGPELQVHDWRETPRRLADLAARRVHGKAVLLVPGA